MPLEADLALAKLLTARKILSPEQIAAAMRQAADTPGTRLSLSEGIQRAGLLPAELIQALLSSLAPRPAGWTEPADLSNRLQQTGRLTPEHRARAAAILAEGKRMLGTDAPTFAQIVLCQGWADEAALRACAPSAAPASASEDPPLELLPAVEPRFRPAPVVDESVGVAPEGVVFPALEKFVVVPGHGAVEDPSPAVPAPPPPASPPVGPPRSARATPRAQPAPTSSARPTPRALTHPADAIPGRPPGAPTARPTPQVLPQPGGPKPEPARGTRAPTKAGMRIVPPDDEKTPPAGTRVPAATHPVGPEPTPVRLQDVDPAARSEFEQAPGAPEGLCPSCDQALAPDQQTRSCAGCGRVYHATCWDERQGCTQSTCRQIRGSTEMRVLSSGPGATVQWLRHYAWMLVAGVFLLVLLAWGSQFFFHDAAWYYQRSVEARSGLTSDQQLQRLTDPNRGIEVDESPDGKTKSAQVRERLKKQIAYLRQALALDPTLVQAWADLGMAGAEQGEAALAREGFERAASLDPKNHGVRLALGALLENAGDIAAAEARFREATTLAPEVADGWRRLGALLDRHRPDVRAEALAAYERALAIEPEHEDTRIRKAVAQVRLGQSEQAIPALETLYTGHPGHEEVRWAVACAYRDVNRDADAERIVATILVHQPEDVDARLLFAELLLRQRRYEEAVTALDPVASDAQKRSDVFRRRAQARAPLHQVTAALADAEHAVQLHAGVEERRQLLVVLLQAGRAQAARALAESLAQGAADPAALALLLAEARLSTGDPAAAAEALARAPECPERGRLNVRLARATGPVAAAEAAANALLERDPSGPSQWEAGMVVLDEQPGLALARFRKAAEAGAHEGWLGEALLWQRLGEIPSAVAAAVEFLARVPEGGRAEEARGLLQTLNFALAPEELTAYARIAHAHARVCGPPATLRRKVDAAGAMLIEIAALLRLPSRQAEVLEQDAAALGAAVDAIERSPAQPSADPLERNATGRTDFLRTSFEEWARLTVQGLQSLETLAARDGIDGPRARLVEAAVGTASGKILAEPDTGIRAALGLEQLRMMLRERWVGLPQSTRAAALWEAAEQRRRTSERFARSAPERIAGAARLFAENLVDLLGSIEGQPHAVRVAAGLGVKLDLAWAGAHDSLDQTLAALTVAAEALQVLVPLRGGGFAAEGGGK